MAKVMISLPEPLLERIDAHVRAHKTTRSAYLRDLALRDLAADGAERGALVRRLLADPEYHRGDSTYLVKKARWSR